jgi:RNA polymerase sigma-70 factor (ECF subfamily)
MPTSADIDRLVAAWRDGDRSAFDALVEAVHEELRIHLAALCDRREVVEEALQDAFITCFERIGSYRGPGSFLAWMRAIARNRLRDYWRERQRAARLAGNLTAEIAADAFIAACEEPDEQPSRSQRLAACLERLPAKSRRLIEARHLHDESLSTMAQRFHAPMEALSVTLHRIRAALRRCIEGAP